MSPTEEHALDVQRFATQSGVLQWHTRMACADYYSDYLDRVVRTMSDPAVLREIGFATPGSHAPNRELALKSERLMATTMMDLIRNIFSSEATSGMCYSNRLPHKFAGLLVSDEVELERMLCSVQDHDWGSKVATLRYCFCVRLLHLGFDGGAGTSWQNVVTLGL
jgi:hypothetical protein